MIRQKAYLSYNKDIERANNCQDWISARTHCGQKGSMWEAELQLGNVGHDRSTVEGIEE